MPTSGSLTWASEGRCGRHWMRAASARLDRSLAARAGQRTQQNGGVARDQASPTARRAHLRAPHQRKGRVGCARREDCACGKHHDDGDWLCTGRPETPTDSGARRRETIIAPQNRPPGTWGAGPAAPRGGQGTLQRYRILYGPGRFRMRPSKGSDAADMTPEQLRSAHIRVLERLEQAQRENAELQMQLSERGRQSQRMTPEELDSVYVEERRQIESLQREVASLKGQAAGGCGLLCSHGCCRSNVIHHLLCREPMQQEGCA